MTTKIEKCMKILKFIPEPSSLDIYNISREVGCNPRQVYRAWSRLKQVTETRSKEVKIIKVLYNFLINKCVFTEEPTVEEQKTIEEAEEMLDLWS